MSDARRSALFASQSASQPASPSASQPAGDERGRVVRLLLIVLGVLGFVVLPGAAPASGSVGAGVRAGAAQPGQPGLPGPASRGRGAKTCPAPRADCVVVSVAAATSRQAAPATAPVPDQIPAVAGTGAGIAPAPAVARLGRAPEHAGPFETAPPGLPRGRAPPSFA
ncbi:hypothetical protein [Spirillospora sp. NPDC047279]|uniref:hypothetical protein n=1 Tax=Spirillospora sp. NPDC047279 TaxID=3155478 RepID=UPI0033D6533C